MEGFPTASADKRPTPQLRNSLCPGLVAGMYVDWEARLGVRHWVYEDRHRHRRKAGALPVSRTHVTVTAAAMSCSVPIVVWIDPMQVVL